MRKTIGSILVFSAIAMTPTATADEAATCEFYGKMGAVLADEMLDLTLREVVQALNGTRSDVMDGFANAVANSMTQRDIDALNSLTGDQQNILGESAGGKTMSLLMEGRANSGTEVRQMLSGECKSRGLLNIINNQRAANQLLEVQ